MAQSNTMGDDPDEDDKDKKSKKRPDVPLFRDMVLRKTIGKQQVKGPSPLVMLQEVFEETLDKGRFVGITMFWKYFEDINIDRIKHVTSVEYRNLRLMFWETIFYAGLLFFFTLYCFNCMSSAVYQARNDQLQYWGGCVGNHCRIHEVNDVNSFWQWMSNDFVNLAFTKFDYMPKVANLTTYFPDNDFSITMSPRFVGHDFSNVLLGTIRIRQARVLADTGCENSKLFSHAYPTCYGRYSADTRSKESYASRFAPFYLMGAFDWKDTDVTQQTGINGELGSYSGDGYFADFPPDERQTRTMIDDLWTWRWLDKATRAIVLELTMLNTNVNVITNTKILFEFGPTGSVVATIKTTASQVHFFTPSLKSGVALTVFLLQLVVFILFLVYTVWTGFLMFKSCRNFVGQNPIKYMRKQNCAGKFIFIVQTFVHHFGYIWNLCDLLLITLYFVHITLRFVTYIYVSAASNLASNVIGHPEYFMPFAGPMRDLQTSANVLAVTAVISWVKPFKYLCMMVWFRMLTRIMERCIAKLFTFAVLLLFVMFGFAVAFFCGFGATNQMFAGLQNTFLVLFFHADRWIFHRREMVPCRQVEDHAIGAHHVHRGDVFRPPEHLRCGTAGRLHDIRGGVAGEAWSEPHGSLHPHVLQLDEGHFIGRGGERAPFEGIGPFHPPRPSSRHRASEVDREKTENAANRERMLRGLGAIRGRGLVERKWATGAHGLVIAEQQISVGADAQ
mmetsp:Transcript_108190/g.304812  ORF Transcript_108190/g.304812 Transcript_108190/m.304812 type:complete len:731 (-) Transcript_108190:581-2773(-)